MELLARYLQAVRGYLLRSRRDDIVKELGDNILAEMEDRSVELGRGLTEAEQAVIIKQHGHPLVAAAPYRNLPLKQLIGPTLFPLYWYALQAMAFFVFAFHLVLAMVLTISNHSVLRGLAGAWGSFWLWITAGVGGITIGFGLVEYFGGGKIPLTDTFNPLDLPELKSTSLRDKAQVELVLGSIFLVGWPIFLHLQLTAFTASIPIHLAPVWRHFEIPMLLTLALGTAAAFVTIFRPNYSRLRAILRLASDVLGVIVLYFFLMAREFMTAAPSAAAQLNASVAFGAHTFTVGQIVNYAIALGPLIAMIVFFSDGIAELVRLLRTIRQPNIAPHQSAGVL